MAWSRVLIVALVVCAIWIVGADNKSQPTAHSGTNKTVPSPGKGGAVQAVSTKLDDPPYRPTSKDTRYYVGRYAGSCRGKGMYYKDKFTFVICQHHIRHTQRCPAGTMNNDITHFHPRTFYDITPFCSINLNDYGYTVSKRKAFALHKGFRSVSRPPPVSRAAQGRRAPPGGAPGVMLKGYQTRRPIITSKDPAGYGAPSGVKGPPIDPHHTAHKGRSREVRAAEWDHKRTYSKYPKHTKKDVSVVRLVHTSLEEASTEGRRRGWSYEDSPEYLSTEYDAYPPDRPLDVQHSSYNSRQSDLKPSRFAGKRPIYPESKRGYSASYELSAEHPDSREASYSDSYHRDHSYESRKPYLPPARGARSPRQQLIKAPTRPVYHDTESSVEYPIHHRPRKSSSAGRPVDRSYKGDYYGKGPSRELSVRKYKSGSPHIPRDNYRSSPYKDSREWSTDRLHPQDSHPDDIYPGGSHKGGRYSSAPPMGGTYRRDYSSERTFTSVENEYDPPPFKDSPFLGGKPKLNTFETSIFGDGGFPKDDHFGDQLRKGPYPMKSPKWDDTYSAAKYDRQLSSTKGFPYSAYSGMVDAQHGAKTGPPLPRTSPLFGSAFESQKTNGNTDTYDGKLMEGSAGEDLPKRPDYMKKWLTDLSDIESKYQDGDLTFPNGNPAKSRQSLFDQGPESKELGFDTSFGDKNTKDVHDNEFSEDSANKSPPQKSEAEWKTWLTDLSDIAHKYTNKDHPFQRSSSSEIHTVDFGTQNQQMPFNVNPSLQTSSDGFGDSGKSISQLGKPVGFGAGFGAVNGSGINSGQDSDEDWAKWLTDLSDIAPQYEGPKELADFPDHHDLRNPSQATEAPSGEFSKNNIKYNPFKETGKTEAEWDKWLKDSSDIGPMVKRNQNKNQEPRLAGSKNGLQKGRPPISGFGRSTVRFAGGPQLPFNRPDVSSTGNVKINPGFGNNYNMQHVRRPQGNHAVRTSLGNQQHHGNARSIGNAKFNPYLSNNAINRQQPSFNNNPRPDPRSLHIGHPIPNTNIPVRSSGQQNTQLHGRPNIPPNIPTDYSKVQYRKPRAMRSDKDTRRPKTFGKNIQISNNTGEPAKGSVGGTIKTTGTQDSGSSSRTGEVQEAHAASRAPVIMSRMFNMNRYENGRETVRRQVRPLVGVKLHQVLTTPVSADKSSGVTGQRIVLSSV